MKVIIVLDTRTSNKLRGHGNSQGRKTIQTYRLFSSNEVAVEHHRIICMRTQLGPKPCVQNIAHVYTHTQAHISINQDFFLPHQLEALWFGWLH